MEAGSTARTVFQTECIQFQLCTDTQSWMCFFIDKKVEPEKGQQTRAALVLLFSLGLLNRGRATRNFALFSSSIFDSEALHVKASRPVPDNYNNRLIFTNQMWHSERLVGTGLLFSATKPKWSLLLPSSFNTLSTGIHTDSQHNLFWKCHGGLMRNFCPKYGSFVVVMPPQGNNILGAWHLPKAALTHRAKCQDKGYQASSLLPQWNKPQESVALLLYMLQHVMSSTDLHGSGCKASFTASGVPILSASFKPALILILSALGDKTALHKMFTSARNLI